MKLSAFFFIAAIAAFAQQPEPSFEVASIKPNVSNDPNQLFRLAGASPAITNQTLRNIILWAYDLRDFQVTGGAGWVTTDHWDIEAKVSPSASMDDKRKMVQSLLEDRFHLAIHRETKQLPIFNMVVVKGGLKIQPIQEGSCIAIDPSKPPQPTPGKSPMDYCGSSGFGRGMLMAASATMTELATLVSHEVGRTVVDKTGVSGRFHIQLKYTQNETTTSQPDAAPSDGPSIYTALQEQLGLHLDSAKGPVEVLVIDHAEKPSEN